MGRLAEVDPTAIRVALAPAIFLVFEQAALAERRAAVEQAVRAAPVVHPEPMQVVMVEQASAARLAESAGQGAIPEKRARMAQTARPARMAPMAQVEAAALRRLVFGSAMSALWALSASPVMALVVAAVAAGKAVLWSLMAAVMVPAAAAQAVVEERAAPAARQEAAHLPCLLLRPTACSLSAIPLPVEKVVMVVPARAAESVAMVALAVWVRPRARPRSAQVAMVGLAERAALVAMAAVVLGAHRIAFIVSIARLSRQRAIPWRLAAAAWAEPR